jgi:succinyldiaminopimelate transaminase
MTPAGGFVPPPYPYDRLAPAAKLAAAHVGGAVDLSIGTPCDPPPACVVDALALATGARGYPPSLGTPALRESAQRWLARRFDVNVDLSQIAACIGTKEFVGTTPHWLRLRSPHLDTVLYPAVAYPTYAMGAQLAGCRAVPVPVDADERMQLDAISSDDAARALCLWVNTPGNPAGQLDDLDAAATWGRARGVPVLSDECYVEFTWTGAPRTILSTGTDGVLAVHSLSKRSNLAGMRVGIYAGDGELVHYLSEVRKHVGMMVPGPIQAAAVAAFDDDDHVMAQREVYRRRLATMAGVMERWLDQPVALPDGGFYLWIPTDDAWGLTNRLAAEGGALVSPGDFYDASNRVRIAMVQPDEAIELVAQRLGVK